MQKLVLFFLFFALGLVACQSEATEQNQTEATTEEEELNPLPEVEAASPNLAPINPQANFYENDPDVDGFERSILLKKVGPNRFSLEIKAIGAREGEICNYQIGAIERTKQVLEGEVRKSPVQFIREEAALLAYPVDSMQRRNPGRLCPGGSINGYYLPKKFLKTIFPAGTYLPNPGTWVYDEYLSHLNDLPNGPQLGIHYETEIITLADYNGDKQPDYAAFLINKDKELGLYAMLSNNGRWEAERIAFLGKQGDNIEDPYVGAGLDSESAGSSWKGAEEGSVTLTNAGIVLKVYEQSNTLYYLEGEEWKSLVLKD